MMLKLEGEAITVYFIDHGNCIELKNLAEVTTHELYYHLISSLFDFLHSRYHGGSVSTNSGNTVKSQKRPLSDSSDTAPAPREQAKTESSTISEKSARHHSGPAESSVTASLVENDPFEFPPTVSSQSPVPVRFKYLTLRPLTDSAHDQLNNSDFTKHMVSVFGPDAEPSADLIQWCREERSVEDICGKLYEWVTTDWIGGSANRNAIIPKSQFVDDLSFLLCKTAFESNDFRDLSDIDQKQRPAIQFDNYVHGLGFSHPGSQLMLMRVVAQIKAFCE